MQQPSPGPKRRLSPRRSQRSRSATARHPGETARRSGGSCGGRWLPSLAAGPDAAIALVAPRHPDADPVRHARRENLPSSHHGHLATPGGGTCLARIPGRARPAGCRHPRARRRFAGTLRVVRIARPEIEELLDLGGQPLRTMWLATVDGTPKRWLATPPGAARHARLRLTVLSEIPVARATAAIPPRPCDRASAAAHRRRDRSFNNPCINPYLSRIAPSSITQPDFYATPPKPSNN